MARLKLVVFGDGGIYTGFGRVNHSIIENLPPDDYEVHHIAINYRGDPFKTEPWHLLYPASLGGDMYGIGRVEAILATIKPDIIFILNDTFVIPYYLEQFEEKWLNRTVIYFPIDAEYIDEVWVENYEKLGAVVAYTEFGKKEILKTNPELNVKVIPHGTNTEIFYPIERNEARAHLAGLNSEDFIVLNANRNQPRKRVDLTWEIFSRFAKDKPSNVRLYLHMGIVDEGWHIERMALKMAKRYEMDDWDKRLILTSRDLGPGAGVTDFRLNQIFNACDVGLNTSMGEGWGLVNTEHAATGAVQLVPDASACKYIFGEGRGFLLPVLDTPYTYPSTLTEGRIVDVDSGVEILEEVYANTALREKTALAGYEFVTQEELLWKNVAKQWDRLYKKVAINARSLEATKVLQKKGNAANDYYVARIEG